MAESTRAGHQALCVSGRKKHVVASLILGLLFADVGSMLVWCNEDWSRSNFTQSFLEGSAPSPGAGYCGEPSLPIDGALPGSAEELLSGLRLIRSV